MNVDRNFMKVQAPAEVSSPIKIFIAAGSFASAYILEAMKKRIDNDFRRGIGANRLAARTATRLIKGSDSSRRGLVGFACLRMSSR
jgi:hypothetical protein